MKRGTNDFGVEADVVALDVGLCDPSNAAKCVVVWDKRVIFRLNKYFFDLLQILSTIQFHSQQIFEGF